MGEFLEAIPVLLILWVLFEVLTGSRNKGKQKRGKTPPVPRQPEPQPSTSAPRSGEGQRPRGDVARTGAGGGSAADMLPDDLWAILTGQHPPQRSPQPAPAEEAERPFDEAEQPIGEAERPVAATTAADATERPASTPARAGRSNESDRGGAPWRDTGTLQPAGPLPTSSRDLSPERTVARPEPHVVSLEVPPPPPKLRHAAFRRRLAASRKVPGTAPADGRFRIGLGSRDELHRAIVLREVLGPPRGLD